MKHDRNRRIVPSTESRAVKQNRIPHPFRSTGDFLTRCAGLDNRGQWPTQLLIDIPEASMLPAAATLGWSDDWMWGLALIALSVVTHAAGLALIGVGLAKVLGSMIETPWHVHRRFVVFSIVVGVASVLLALLHGVEASYWAAAYVWLGAATDFRWAIYFSLQMVTDRWKLMGPLEAISGMLLFGLSTAFLLAIMQRVWPFPQAMRARPPVDRS
jgi:hypothetical protein